MSSPRAVLHTMLDTLFPPRRVTCRTPGALLCVACLRTIHAPTLSLCLCCGRSIDGAVAASTTSGVCALCASGHTQEALDALRAAAVYEGVLRQAVLALKFRGQRRVAELLGALLAEEVRRVGWLADVVVPV